jgi:RNA polymerase sigma-70 factor (ECF subfamily)
MMSRLVSLPLPEGWFCPAAKAVPGVAGSVSRTDDEAARELTARVAKGDEQAFRDLYERYQGRLFRLAIVLSRGDESLAQETVQSVFLTAARKLRRVESEAHLWNWLARVARQHLAKAWRQQARDPVLADSETLNDQPMPEQADAVLEEHLNAALAQMEPEDCQVLEWFYFDELSHKEMAERLGTTTKAVSSRLERVRAALRRTLQRRLANET